MLPISILGKGLIPRLGRLAPANKPVEVPLKYLKVIVATPYLRSFYKGADGQTTRVTLSNYQMIWDNHQLFIENETAKKEPPEPKQVVDPIMRKDDQVHNPIISKPSIVVEEPIVPKENIIMRDIVKTEEKNIPTPVVSTPDIKTKTDYDRSYKNNQNRNK